MKRMFLLGIVFVAVLSACAQNPVASTTSSPSPTAVAAAQPLTRAEGVQQLAMDARGEKLYKAASDGLFVSGDEGKTWRKVALPNEIADKGVSQIALRKESPETMFIAGEEIGIWRSRDAGASWKQVNNEIANGRITALTLHSNGYPRDESKGLYVWVDRVGVFESHDDGDSWKQSADTKVGLSNQDVTALTHTALEGSMNTGWLYAATSSGAYLSMDCF